MRTLCFILFSYLLISCSKPSETLLPELSRAESLMQEYPDSALAILDSMQAPSPSNEMQYATWCLFRTQAQDKSYIKHTSDSLINISLSYFEKQNDVSKKVLSLYYKARVADDMHNAEEATTYYLQANDLAKEIKDYNSAQLISSNLGMLYMHRKLYDLAEPTIREAYDYSVLTKDSANISYFLSYLARVAGAVNKWDSCIYYYNQATIIAEQSKNIRALSLALGEISYAYIELNKYEQAINYLNKAQYIETKHNFNGLIQTQLALGIAYIQAQEYDSAAYYLNESLKSNNLYTTARAYQNLYMLNEKQNKYEDAIAYNNLHQTYADSIAKITHTKEVTGIQAKYEHEKLVNRNNQLEIKNGNILKYGLVILILIINITAVTIFIYQRKLLHKERYIQKNKEQIKDYILTISKNESTINNNNQLIQVLTENLEESTELKDHLNNKSKEIEQILDENKALRTVNKTLQKNIDRYSYTYLTKGDQDMDLFTKLVKQNAYLLEHERFLSEQLISRIDILNQLKEAPKHLTNEQWIEIIDMVNMLFDNYTLRLRTDFPSLTDEDLRHCCLLKLRLSIPAIAIETGISSTSVTKRKQRIRDKINQDKTAPLGKEQSTDAFLWSY